MLLYYLASRDGHLLPLEPRLQQRSQHSFTLLLVGYAFVLGGGRPRRGSLLDLFRRNLKISYRLGTFTVRTEKNISSLEGSTHPYLPCYRQEISLCPVRCIEVYLSRTGFYREDISQVLLTPQKSFKQDSKGTVANWIERTFFLARVDSTVCKAHTNRAASTPKAKKASVSLVNILSVGDWSSDTAFHNFYYRETHLRATFVVGVLALI